MTKKTITDLTYVNNKEFSDVTFLVEDKMFYAHKIVIVTGKFIYPNIIDVILVLFVKTERKEGLFNLDGPFKPWQLI